LQLRSVLIIILFMSSICRADTYFVDTASSGTGDGTTQDLTGSHAAWKNISEITGLAAGDSVLFKRGDTWTTYLPITDENITFDAYGTGDKPLIDLSGVAGNPGYPDNIAIYVLEVTLCHINNIRVKGSGYNATVMVSTKSGGSNYGVVCTNVDVLQNWNTASPPNGWDAFAVNSTSQLELVNCTVAKCRYGDWESGYAYLVDDHVYYDSGSGNILYKCTENHTSTGMFDALKFSTSGVSESNQALTGHIGTNRIKATGCTFSDCSSGIRFGAITEASVALNDCTFSDIIRDVFNLTANVVVTFNSGTVSITQPDGFLVTGTGGVLLINNSTITIGSNVDSGEHAFYMDVTITNTDITCDGLCRIGVRASGSLSVTGGVWDINNAFYHFLLSESTNVTLDKVVFKSSNKGTIQAAASGGVDILHCTFIIDGAVDQVINFNTAGTTTISNCTVYQTGDGSGEFVYFQASTPTVNLTNTICYDVTYVDGGLAGTLNASHNCYYNSEDLAGIGSITAEPLFVDADANDFHLMSNGWRWDGVLYKTSDFTGDKIVNLVDFAELAKSWLISGNLLADINRDNLVDWYDLFLFAANFLTTGDDTSGWTWDDVTSRCIDAGNPGFSLGDEPLTVPADPYNRGSRNLRINMGAYGGTAEASIGPLDWAILSDLNNDGTVSNEDLTGLADNWLNSRSNQPADFNRDGIVNILDMAQLAKDWLKQTSWF